MISLCPVTLPFLIHLVKSCKIPIQVPMRYSEVYVSDTEKKGKYSRLTKYTSILIIFTVYIL